MKNESCRYSKVRARVATDLRQKQINLVKPVQEKLIMQLNK